MKHFIPQEKTTLFPKISVPYFKIDQQKKWLQKLNKAIYQFMGDACFSVAQLARIMNVSERTLHYQVKAVTGLTPAKYVNELRLLKAKQLLENRTYPTVFAVCYMSGFRKTTYFSKLFKKRFNQLPSSYLKH